MKTKRIVRLNETDLFRIVKETVNTTLNEGFGYMGVKTNDRASIGDVLEVELIGWGDKPHYYWHTKQSEDWLHFKNMKDWEIDTSEMPKRFYIKIGR